MGSTFTKSAYDRDIEIRVRFEPGLGAALYASLRDGEVGAMTVAKNLGRGRSLLRYHGFTLMAQGSPDWKAGDSFSVYVKELGPPLVLAPVGANGRSASRRVATVESAVVPGTPESTNNNAVGR